MQMGLPFARFNYFIGFFLAENGVASCIDTVRVAKFAWIIQTICLVLLTLRGNI